MRPSAIIIALGLLLAAGCGPVGEHRRAGDDPRPDRHGEAVGDSPSYRGTDAFAPIPPGMHQRNTGGSDGAGLCVIASIATNGRYQGVGDEVQKLWEEARRRPGGYIPSKLDGLIRDVAPGLKYAQYEGTDLEPLERWSAAGYPVGVTYGTGRLYDYQRIAHMVSLSHLDGQWAAIIDNNNPGKWSWMPAEEFGRRWTLSGGQGWAVLLQYPVTAAAGGLLLVIAAALLLAAAARRRLAESE